MPERPTPAPDPAQVGASADGHDHAKAPLDAPATAVPQEETPAADGVAASAPASQLGLKTAIAETTQTTQNNDPSPPAAPSPTALKTAGAITTTHSPTTHPPATPSLMRPTEVHRSTAWPLAWVYVALVVYASLHPFGPWRWQEGADPWRFLTSPPRQVWLNFDGVSNLVGYAPLGFLLCMGWLRNRPYAQTWAAMWRAMIGAALGGALLSLIMETTQNYLPMRVPSMLDLSLNSAGSALGAALAALSVRLGWVRRWAALRARWFVPAARGTLALLALWPFALLYPTAVPLGLGQVLERGEEALGDWLMDTPFLEWLPMRAVELQPLLPGAEMWCVLLGALAPCLLAYSIVPRGWRRAVALALGLVGAVGMTSLSTALSYGPQHAWAWITPSAHVGLAGFAILAGLLIWLPPRACAVVALLALAWHLSLVNQAPTSAYFALTLQEWEQGRFARFNGLGQWLGWLWPYAALAVLVMRLSARRSRHPAASPSGFDSPAR